jgi:inorganic pyrophosphatase
MARIVRRNGANDSERTRRGVLRPGYEGDLQDVRRLPARAVDELENSFEATNALEDKELKFLGWRGPTKAIKTIKQLAR